MGLLIFLHVNSQFKDGGGEFAEQAVPSGGGPNGEEGRGGATRRWGISSAAAA